MIKNVELESPSFRYRLAHVVSQISHPLLIALPIFLIVALHTAPDILRALIWWGVTVVGISVIPLLFIWRGVHRGEYSDQHLSIREQRIIPLLFGLGCVVIVFVSLLLLQASLPLMATITSIFFGGIITLLITRYWKISLHLVAISGFVTVLVLVFGPLFLFLSPLIVLVGWARWQVRAHTFLQAIAGTLLAASVTIVVFWLFRVL